MLKETVSFLRRLVRGPRRAQELQEEGEERRVRVRYPCNLETTLYATNGQGPLRLSGRVRNISRGGIKLVVGQKFEPGELLNVELPGPDGQAAYNVLACVVHAAAGAAGDWALGCAFAQELTDDELRPFGARRQKPATREDLRHWVRFPCDR